MLFITNTLLPNSFIFHLFGQRGPWWPVEPRGVRGSVPESELCSGIGPPLPTSMQLLRPFDGIKTSLLIRQHLVHFRTAPDSTDTHTQNTHTVGTQFAAVLQPFSFFFFFLENGSSITPLSEKKKTKKQLMAARSPRARIC